MLSMVHRTYAVVTAVACLLLPGASLAQTLGVIGDSLSDEYAEESYGAYAQNWNEQLVNFAAIDLGPTATEASQPGGTWGEPRRTVYQYNWARSGATSGSLLSGGQHTGLAGLVAPEGISYAVMMIGANDFHPSGAAYQNIYADLWSSAQVDAYVGGVVANLNAALDTVLPTGVMLAIVNLPDYGLAPQTQSFFPDAVGRQRVADAILQVNAAIDQIAQTRHLVVLDLLSASIAIFGPHGSPNSTLVIGNVAIDLAQTDTASGANPTAGFVHDGIHPNTTLQGVIANSIVEALNIGYGAGFALFTEEQILGHRGIAYGGSDTLVAQLGNYGDYVTSYVAVSVPVLEGGALAVLVSLLAGLGWKRAR